MNRETVIEDAILKDPGALGYPDALAIRHCRIGQPSGLVDIVLLPRVGPVDLVLVEAKAVTSSDATSKVIGQLLMYYAGALSFGQNGLALLRRFAEKHADEAQGHKKISPKRLTGGLTPATSAWKVLQDGPPLSPERIQLWVAFDQKPHDAFIDVVRVLRERHALHIGYCVVQNCRVSRVVGADTDVHLDGSA
jgi:hypothetical protein